MNEAQPSTDRKVVRVGVADVAVSGNGAALATSGLGSCVAIALHDSDGDGVGGLLHAMLPTAPDDDPENPAKYVDTGLAILLDEIESRGGDRTSLVAKFAGGSAMLNIGSGDGIGEKNVAATHQALSALDIELAGVDTGGGSGRSIRFHPSTGDYVVERVDGDTRIL